MISPAGEGFPHFGFGVDAEGVGDAIDVIEIGDHFNRVQNVAVGELVFAQGFQVLRANRGGRARNEFGKFAERLLAGRQFRELVVVLDVLGQLGILRFLTEILSVRFDSIETMIGPGNDRGQHLALGPREPRFAAHRRQIKVHRRPQRAWVQALHRENIENLPGSCHRLLILGLQFAGSFGGHDGFDPSHNLPTTRK